MTLNQVVDTIISVGKAAMIGKRFLAAMGALWFYDYFLTLSDEIGCVWSGRKSLVFVVFLLNRYWPVWCLLWLFVAFWSPGFTRPMCDKTAWLSMFYFTFATFFAQVVITLRIYVITGKNRRIATCLSFMTSLQVIFGAYHAVLFSLRPAEQFPSLPFDEYKNCLFQRWRTREIVFASLSLVYDASAFLVIVYATRNRAFARAAGTPSILENILRDATSYFFVIFTGHLLLVLFELLASEPIQLLPSCANAVLMPMMITRLIVSLKKAASTQPRVSIWGLSGSAGLESAVFANPTIGGTECDSGDIDISLGRENGLSQSCGES